MAEIPLWFQITVVAALGACVGSFLNVCIYRLPRGLSIIRPGSHCPHCKHPLYWHHNIPLIGYLLLRGRCHFCQDPISPRYFVVELLAAGLFAALFLYSFSTPKPLLFFGVHALFISGLIVATFIDLEFFLIPDAVSLGGIPVGILACALLPFMMDQTSPLRGSLLSLFSALFGGSLLLLISFLGKKAFKKEAMGMGDVKFLAMIGSFLGLKKVCLTLFFGSVLGSILGLILIARARAGLKSQIPFGPYLAAGAILALFFGDPLWNWYFGF